MLISVAIAKSIVKYTLTKAAKGEYVNCVPALKSIDMLGNDNGMVELDDVVQVIKDFAQGAIDTISDIWDFISDII